MHIIRAEEKPLVPWKNGGGLTREIAVHFDHNRHADFLWRVSMAVVDRAGGFSHFEGIDRTLAVLDGQGLVLKSLEGEVMLDQNSVPYRFAGELEIEADLPDGAITDLNIMTRRGFFRHTMEKCSFYNQQILQAAGDVSFIICHHGEVMAGEHKLCRFDVLAGIEKGMKVELAAQGRGEVLVITLLSC